MYSFIRNFSAYIRANNIPFTHKIDDEYDLLFVNSWAVDYRLVYRAKKRRSQLKVVQRVDGSARDYGRYDDADKRQARVNLLADLTIFQSRYSKYSSREKYKVIAQDGPIIYNPVDVQMFCPDGPRLPLAGEIRVCNASFSTNVKKGTWQIGDLARANPGVDFILCGRYPELPDLPNIHLLGHLNHEELSAAMRSCHVFLFPSENEACPNTVLEALASGLPVLYKDSGGTPELVGDCGRPVTAETFRDQLEAVLKRHDEFSNAARERAVQHFSPGHIFPQYLEAMAQAKRRSLATTRDLLLMWLRGYPVVENPIPQLVGRARRKGSDLLQSLYRVVRL